MADACGLACREDDKKSISALLRKSSTDGSADSLDAPRERHRLYVWVWRASYVVNLAAFALAILVQPWQKVEMPAYWALSAFAILGVAVNIIVADIVTESICILLALWMPKPEHPLPDVPASDSKTQAYLVIYCLKSSAPEDVHETLAYMKASWRLNQLYMGSTFCLLSGTQDARLAEEEMQAVKEWNADHREYGMRIRYVRRMRSVLHKYGQYLDFIMLLNGYKRPMLYRDVKSNHPSGLCFDPESPDVDFFCGSSYEFLVIMDRDNMLSPDFFHKANHIFAAHPNIQILQPAISPYPKNFRRALNDGESIYTSLNSKFQVIGNELSKLLRMHIPMASFYGKGILRRSAYNDVLLCLDHTSGATREEWSIPRDLISHDILESTCMRSMLCPDIEVYEDMPMTHVEWHLRQQRWDLGDLITAKYIFPHTYGLLPNILTHFSYCHVRPFFASKWSEMSNIIYTSCFNTRTLNIKCAMLLLMGAFTFADFRLPYGLIGLSGFVNVELVLLPLLITVCVVRGLTWKEHILVQLFNTYMGVIDIYFASFRTLRAFYRMVMGKNKWNTYRVLGHSPLMTMVCFIQEAIPELVTALAVTALYVWSRWNVGIRVGDIFLLIYLGLIITFPIYTFITSLKRGKYDPASASNPLSYMRDSKSGKLKSLQSVSSIASCIEDVDFVSVALGEVLATCAKLKASQPSSATEDSSPSYPDYDEFALGNLPDVAPPVDAPSIGHITQAFSNPSYEAFGVERPQRARPLPADSLYTNPLARDFDPVRLHVRFSETATSP